MYRLEVLSIVDVEGIHFFEFSDFTEVFSPSFLLPSPSSFSQ